MTYCVNHILHTPLAVIAQLCAEFTEEADEGPIEVGCSAASKQLLHDPKAGQTYSRKRSRRAASYTQVISFVRQVTQVGTSPEHLTSVEALDRIQTVTTIGSEEGITSFTAGLASSGAVSR